MPEAPAGDASTMCRLLFVTKYIDHILYFFLEKLSSTVDLTVVVGQSNDWTRRLAASGINLTRLAPRTKFDRDFRQAVNALAPRGGWDLIQCFHGNAELANLIRWNRSRIPLIAYRARIGHLKFRENPMAYWNARNPTLAAVAAVSNEVKAYLESFPLLRARNVRVIHHGINREWVDEQARATVGLRSRLDIPGGDLIVVSMSALRPVKRFEYIVHAAERLKDRPIHFVHIGEPNGWDRKAAHLPRLHFLGRLERPFPVIAEADVFAMTSRNEAFGRANLEAMACGKAVVGSNTGGLLDIVDPEVTGRLFEAENPDHFAAIIAEYCDDRSTVEQHGRNAVERVDRRFTTGRMVNGYLSLYEDVLAGRS